MLFTIYVTVLVVCLFMFCIFDQLSYQNDPKADLHYKLKYLWLAGAILVIIYTIAQALRDFSTLTGM